jgi:hypothetical protein
MSIKPSPLSSAKCIPDGLRLLTIGCRNTKPLLMNMIVLATKPKAQQQSTPKAQQQATGLIGGNGS